MKNNQNPIDSDYVNYKFPSRGAVALMMVLSFLAVAFCVSDTGEFSIGAGYILFLIFGLLFAALVSDGSSKDRAYILKLYSFVYSVNALVIILFAYYFVSQSDEPFIPAIGSNSPDDIRYYESGRGLLERWGATGATLFDPLKGYKYIGFSYVIAFTLFVAQFFGDLSPITPRFFNAMMGAGTVVLIFRIGNIVYGKRVAYTAALVSICFTAWYYYSVVLLRDIFVAFFVCLYMYSALLLGEKGYSKIKAASFIFMACVGVYYFRSPVVYILLLATGIFLVMNINNKVIRYGLATVCCVFYLLLLIADIGPFRMILDDMLNQADRWGSGRSSLGDSSLAIRFIFNAPGPLYVALITAYTAYMPIPPIQGFMLHHFFIGIGNALWYFLCFFWVYAMLVTFKQNKARFLTIVTVMLFFGVALIQPDIRHKTQFLGMGMVQVAYGLVVLEKKRVKIIAVTGFILGALACLYLVLKL